MTSDKAVDDRFSSIGTVEFNGMRYILQEEVDIVLIYGERHQSLQEKALPKKHQAKLIFMPTYEREKSRYRVTRDTT